MGEMRCGEPDCGEMASTESIVEMANLTGGMLGGLFSQHREYRCPSGHVTVRDEITRVENALKDRAKRGRTGSGSDSGQDSTAS